MGRSKKPKNTSFKKLKEVTIESMYMEAEEDIFTTAMKGVEQSIPKQKTIAYKKQKKAQKPSKTHITYNVKTTMNSGEFSVEGTSTTASSEAKMILQAMQGKHFRFHHSLDMHGMRVAVAYPTLCSFIQQGYMTNNRILLIITGKGKHSMEGGSILRESVLQWLTEYPLQEVVQCFTTPSIYNGGAGAIAIFCKEYDTTKKILWHKSLL